MTTITVRRNNQEYVVPASSSQVSLITNVCFTAIGTSHVVHVSAMFMYTPHLRKPRLVLGRATIPLSPTRSNL